MTAYVTLLRGINVGPSTQMSMPELRQVHVSLGLGSVATYIRSGNVVFSSHDDADAVRARVAAGIEQHFGVAVDVVLRSAEQLRDVVARNPFPQVDPARLSVAFLSAPLAGGIVENLRGSDFGKDEYAGDGSEIYLHTPNGLGRSKLAAKVGSLRRPAVVTVRSWRTVTRLAEMAAGLA